MTREWGKSKKRGRGKRKRKGETTNWLRDAGAQAAAMQAPCCLGVGGVQLMTRGAVALFDLGGILRGNTFARGGLPKGGKCAGV
eukprot:766195-Hanusia_phi.AAC.3